VVSLAALLAFAEWEVWVVLLAGLWMVLSPFVLGFQHTTAMHVSIGIGLAVSYLAVLDLGSFTTGRGRWNIMVESTL
jgi:hypothetical protein